MQTEGEAKCQSRTIPMKIGSKRKKEKGLLSGGKLSRVAGCPPIPSGARDSISGVEMVAGSQLYEKAK